MKLDEAIRIIETMQDIEGALFTPLGKQALALGIEALKRVKECGQPARCGLLERLPGETEE